MTLNPKDRRIQGLLWVLAPVVVAVLAGSVLCFFSWARSMSGPAAACTGTQARPHPAERPPRSPPGRGLR